MRTVGELLKRARTSKSFSLEDVSKLTKIRISYLQAIENSNYDALPAPVFVKGFIKNYASFLQLDEEEVLAFFRREFDERRAKNKPALKPPQPLRRTRQFFTPSFVIVGVIGVMVFSFMSYLYVQYRSFSKEPELVVEKPTDRLQQSVSYTEVIGKTDEDAIIKINGQTIRTLPNGSFSITVDLAEGENKIRISATNPLGIESVEDRTVYFLKESANQNNTPEATSSAENTTPKFNIEMELTVFPNAAWIKIEADGKDTFEGILNPGTKRLFTGNEKIIVRSGNGGSTSIKMNGKDIGLMGQEGIPVEKEFRKDSL